MTFTELREALIGKEVEYCNLHYGNYKHNRFIIEEVSYANPVRHTRIGGIAIKGGGEVYHIPYSEALRLTENNWCGCRWLDIDESEAFRFKEVSND